MEYESDGKWCANTVNKGLVQGLKKMSGDHPNYSIYEINQNTKKSPGDIRFAVAQTPVEKHQLTLAWKALKSIK